MNQINQQIEIAWPVTALFNYVSDIDNNAQWQNHVIKSEWIRKTEHRVGSTFCNVLSVSGNEVSATMKVTEFVPNRKRTVKLMNSEHLSYSMDFVPLSGDHTRLTIRLKWNEKLDDHFSAAFRTDVDRMKNILETL